MTDLDNRPLCAFLDAFQAVLDARNSAIERVEPAGNPDLIFVKSGDLATQSDNLAFHPEHARGQFVEPGIDPVEALIDTGKLAAQKVDDLVFAHEQGRPFSELYVTVIARIWPQPGQRKQGLSPFPDNPGT